MISGTLTGLLLMTLRRCRRSWTRVIAAVVASTLLIGVGLLLLALDPLGVADWSFD